MKITLLIIIVMVFFAADLHYYRKELKQRTLSNLFKQTWRFLPGGGIVAYLKLRRNKNH